MPFKIMIGGDNLRKVLKSIVVVITVLFLLSPLCLAVDEVKFKDQIKEEDGSLFEKIIAECIGGIAQTVFDFTTRKRIKCWF